MARIKFGSIVVEGAGSLGGHTFQNSRGGAQWRTKPINKKKPSLAQSLIRSYNPQLQQGWRDLTEDQRSTWNTYAVSHGKTNKNGDKHFLSGHSLYMKWNFEYIFLRLPLISSPFAYKVVKLGCNIVSNGTFDDSAGWDVDARWNISGGKANYLNLATSSIRQYLTMLTGSRYQISFDVSSAIAFASFVLADAAGAAFLSGALSAVQQLQSGSYLFNTTVVSDCNRIRVFGLAAGSTFSFDNFVIREIL